MDKIVTERRKTLRRNLRTRVRLFNEQTNNYENAHLENINYSGIYLMTRRRLALKQDVEIAVPSEVDADSIRIKARVIRRGRHRSWGLFSYACRILHSSGG